MCVRIFGDFARCFNCFHLYIQATKVAVPNPEYVTHHQSSDNTCYCNDHLLVYAASSEDEHGQTDLQAETEGICSVCKALLDEEDQDAYNKRRLTDYLMPDELMQLLERDMVEVRDAFSPTDAFVLVSEARILPQMDAEAETVGRYLVNSARRDEAWARDRVRRHIRAWLSVDPRILQHAETVF